MGFFLRITDPPAQETPGGAGGGHTGVAALVAAAAAKLPEKGYRATLDGQRVVLHDASKEVPKGGGGGGIAAGMMYDGPRFTEKGRGDIYVTPCAGILEMHKDADHAAQSRSDAVLMQFFGGVQECAAERQQVTIIHRCTQSCASSDFFQALATSVANAVSGVAERALQIVADEQAKEKQMLRLLASEDTPSGGKGGGQAAAAVVAADGQGGAAGGHPLAPKPPGLQKLGTDGSGGGGGGSKRAALGISFPVQQRLRAMSAQRAASAHHNTRSNGSPPRERSPTSARSNHRFTLLAATHDSELLPPSRLVQDGLQPRSFVAHPPDASGGYSSSSHGARPGTTSSSIGIDGISGSGSNGIGGGADGKISQRRLLEQARHKQTVALIQKHMAAAADDVSSALGPVKNNGWGKELRCSQFNGSTSVLGLPAIPRFDEFIKSFQIDFWLKTDCKIADGKRTLLMVMEGQRPEVGMQFHIGLNFYSDFDEHLRVYLRDAGNRVMEVLVPLPLGFTSGHDFHHVMVRIKALETGKVEVAFDGEPCDRVRFAQQEHPIQFNSWPHQRVYVGSYLDDSNKVHQCLRGTIAEVRFWHGFTAAASGPAMLQRWPLLGDRNPYGKLVEATHSIPEDHPETLLDVRESLHSAPAVCPSFDGRTIVNLGTLGVFGDSLANWSIEIRFKTSVIGRSMSLVGVTDSQQKMIELGVVLNAEPVMSRERYRYHEHHITCFLCDSLGRCCSVLVRGTDRVNVMDGRWHTLLWRVVDSASNKMEVRIDSVVQDILPVYREGPSVFCPLRDYVAIGGHNVRNWRVKNTFAGLVQTVAITLGSEPFVSLTLDEGPGASICMDYSGHHYHGLLVDAESGAVRRHEVNWIPVVDQGITEDVVSAEAVGSTVVIHKNNVVSLAAVRFGGVFDHGGTITETIVDLYTNQPIQLITTDVHVSGRVRPPWRSWRLLPPDAFHVVENIAQWRERIPAILKAHDRTGHMLLVLRIGDCHISLFDLVGPLVPAQATFDCNMMKWKYAQAINGTKGKREQLLNNMVLGLEKLLMEVSSNPTLTARAGPQNLPHQHINAPDMVKMLSASGIPWGMALVAHGLLLNAEYASRLHVFHSMPRVASEDEAASVAVVARAIHRSADERAVIVIQRNWRGKLARLRVAKLEKQRRQRKQQVEEIMSLRRANPLVQPKKNLRAILISCHDFTVDTLPPITTFNVNELGDALRKQGYNVEFLKNPSRSTINKAIGSIEPDSSTFLYLSGYGGALRVRQPSLLSQPRMHVTLEEGHQRAEVEMDANREYHAITLKFLVATGEVMRSDAARAAGKAKGKKGATAAAAANTKNAAAIAQQSRHVEESFRIAREELLKDETEDRTLRLQKEYEAEVGVIQKEIRQVINAAQDFEDNFRISKDTGLPLTFFVSCDCKSMEPLGSEALNVEELVYRALQRQLPPMGFQAIVALDLNPLYPGASGMGLLASSTGHQYLFPYQPEQRHVLSWELRKALNGYMPRIPLKSKEAILLGAVDTNDTMRDWRSFSSYLAHKMIHACDMSISDSDAVMDELSREMPYTADLVPLRSIIATTEQKEKWRRDLETRRGQVTVVFAVDSLKVSSDMNSEFKALLPHVTVNETINLSTVLLSFLNQNRGIDGMSSEALAAEVDRCAPANSQDVKYAITTTAQGVAISFNIPGQNNDKQKQQQWLNSIAARSISWRIPANSFAAKKDLDVERIELLFAVKASGNFRKMKLVQKQRLMKPLPTDTIRFFSVTVDQ